MIADKYSKPYSKIMNWLRRRFSFSLLHSAVMCLRESRSSLHHPIGSWCGEIDMVIAEGQGSFKTVILFPTILSINHLLSSPYIYLPVNLKNTWRNTWRTISFFCECAMAAGRRSVSCRLCTSQIERSRCTDIFGIEGRQQDLSVGWRSYYFSLSNNRTDYRCSYAAVASWSTEVT